MSFELVSASARGARGATNDPNKVSAGFYARRKDSNEWQLVVYVGTNVLKRIGADSDGARVFIHEGKGADHGFFQITPAPAGAPGSYTMSRRSPESSSGTKGSALNNRQVSVSAKNIASLCRRTETHVAEPVAFQVFGSTITIAVPFVHAPAQEGLL